MRSEPGPDPRAWRKDSYAFIPWNDPAITMTGDVRAAGGHALRDGDWEIVIDLGGRADLVGPVLVRHPWSAIIELRAEQASAFVDLFSWHSYPEPAWAPPGGCLTLRPVGRNPLSFGAQTAIYGVLFRSS